MTIEFRIPYNSEIDEVIRDEFCEYLVRNIRKDILDNVVPAKMNLLERDLLNSEFMVWISKPMRIDMSNLVNLIVSKIGYAKRYDTYIICVNQTYIYQGTRTRLDTIARFLDKGTESCPITSFISSIFNEYSRNINKYWTDFISDRVKRKIESRIVVL